MESINQQVWHLMRADPAIMRNLQRKLINNRALAKFLLSHYSLDTSLDSVISSIRRFPMGEYDEEKKALHGVFRDSVVSTSNNISCVTIRQPPADVLPKLHELALPGVRIVTGNDKIKILVKHGLAPKIQVLFKKCEVV